MSQSLLYMFNDLNASIKQRIYDILASKGIEYPFNNRETVIDLSNFSLCSTNKEERYEFLLDSCQVCYISDQYAYNEEGQIFSIGEFIEKNSLEDICAALDYLGENS